MPQQMVGGFLSLAACEVLKKAGLLPDETRDVHISMPVDGVMSLHYDVNIRVQDLRVLAELFEVMANEYEQREKEFASRPSRVSVTPSLPRLIR